MNKRLSILAAALTLSTAAYSAPFLAVGDGAELFLTGTVGVRADDNIFLTAAKVDDVIWDINPGVDLVFGKNSATKGRFSYVESFSNYSDNDDLNTALSAVNFTSNYDDGKSKLDVKAGYNQLNQNTYDVRPAGNQPVLSRRDVSTAAITAEVSVTEKSSVAFGGAYSDTNYKRAGFSDLTEFSVPVTYYYELSPKLDLSFGFRYRNSDVQLGVDSKDYTYRVGFRGEFTPKVIGSVQVGFGTREFDNGIDKDILDIDAAVDFLLSEKTTFRVIASNDFGTSSSGQAQKNFSLGGNIINKASDEWYVRAGLTYRALDYFTRTDDFVEGQLGADYVVNANVTISGAYAYRDYKSDLTGAGFRNNVFSLSANFRY